MRAPKSGLRRHREGGPGSSSRGFSFLPVPGISFLTLFRTFPPAAEARPVP